VTLAAIDLWLSLQNRNPKK